MHNNNNNKIEAFKVCFFVSFVLKLTDKKLCKIISINYYNFS